jgi:putative RecB family exonuclease
MELEAISVSQINLYLTCSLKYRFQYIDRLPRLVQSAGLVFGSAMHKALEWLHKERRNGRNPPLDEVLRVFDADWHAQLLGAEVIFPEDDGKEKLVHKGKELLSQYYLLPPKPVRDAEVYFQLPLVNPTTGEALDIPLRGVIDLVNADDTIDEFKTAARRFSLEDLPHNIQLTAYSYAFEMLYGRPPRDLRLITFLRTKNPDIDVQVTGREKADYERLFNLGKEVLKAVRAGVFIPSRGCWLCKDCEYDPDCREWTGNEEEVMVGVQTAGQ